MCNCGAATETTVHYLLRCPLFSFLLYSVLLFRTLFSSTLQNSSEDHLLTVLLYGSEKYALNVDKEIIRLTINFLKASERFVQPLY